MKMKEEKHPKKAQKAAKIDVKSAANSSDLFHRIMKASVSGNPKPMVKNKKANER